MMGFRDRTYCSRPLDECSCHESRRITPEIQAAAKEWWRGMEGDPPFCLAELCRGRVVPFKKTE